MHPFRKSVFGSAVALAVSVANPVWADELPTSTDASTSTTEKQIMPDAAASSGGLPVSPAADNGTGQLEAGPGPLLDKRKALLLRIMAAKKQGIGIGAYMAEFSRIEGLVKTNQPSSQYEPSLDSLSDSLDDQLKRSEILKTQRPAMTALPERRTAGAPAAPRMRRVRPGADGTAAGQLINMLRSKYGNKLGQGGMGALDKMSPEEKEKLLQSDMAKEMMKKYMGN